MSDKSQADVDPENSKYVIDSRGNKVPIKPTEYIYLDKNAKRFYPPTMINTQFGSNFDSEIDSDEYYFLLTEGALVIVEYPNSLAELSFDKRKGPVEYQIKVFIHRWPMSEKVIEKIGKLQKRLNRRVTITWTTIINTPNSHRMFPIGFSVIRQRKQEIPVGYIRDVVGIWDKILNYELLDSHSIPSEMSPDCLEEMFSILCAKGRLEWLHSSTKSTNPDSAVAQLSHLVRHPNIKPSILFEMAEHFPIEMGLNPVMSLLPLENPAIVEEYPTIAQMCVAGRMPRHLIPNYIGLVQAYLLKEYGPSFANLIRQIELKRYYAPIREAVFRSINNGNCSIDIFGRSRR